MPVERAYAASVATLQVDAVNPELVELPLGLNLLFWLAHMVRWELTCGFCRTRFRAWILWRVMPTRCPACGTLNRVRR
jgi:hypothetical protein